jgi:GNAT superfamily N-acetyltransferase
MGNSKFLLKEIKMGDKHLEREFIELPKRLYKDNPYWVCPFDSSIKAVFDPTKNKLFAEGEAIRWVAYNEQGECVGRIAAFYDKTHAYGYEQPTGGCGFFEAIDNQQLANMLFDAAREWLKERGMEAMDGPVNFGSRDAWWGLLVEGYEYQPLFENPYNHPYYKALFENYGFQNYFNQNTYVWKIYDDDVNEIVHERVKRLMSTPGYRFAPIGNESLYSAVEKIRTIYNKAWALFTGVQPMTSEEARQMADTMRPIIDRNLIWFAYFNDEPIGFFVMIPDLNRIIGKFGGKFGLWQKLQLMWDLKVRHSCDRAFGIIFGITPEFQGKGIESAIMTYILENYVQKGLCPYKSFEFAWIGDFNPVMNRMIERYVCATKHKMHTTYRYLFDRTRPFERCPRLGLKRPKK